MSGSTGGGTARQTRRRWFVVAAGTAAVLAAPTLGTGAVQLARDATRDEAAQRALDVAPRQLLERILGSAGVAHQGVAESRGALGLPDLPRLGDVAGLLGDTTRTRVWWRSPSAWRVDRVTPTGEEGLYAQGRDVLVDWDYERQRIRAVLGTPAARLPRADDLLPPQLGRRLLGGLGPADRVTALPSRWVADRRAAGLRVEPADGRSTIGAVEVWADPSSGLPLELHVTTRAGRPAITTRWLELDLQEPAAELLRPPAPASASSDITTAPDLVARVDALRRWELPARLAGTGATRSLAGGTATYGEGLARFVVLPLPRGPARDILDAARGLAPRRNLPGGEIAAVRSGVLSALAVVGNDGEHAYVLAGLVTPELLEQAAGELLAEPPPPAGP